MAESYTVPEGIAVLTVHARTAPGKVHIPEYSKPHAITLDIFQINAADVKFQTTVRFDGDDGLLAAHEMIKREGWRLLAFNAFNFDLRILSSRVNVEEYLPRTIDVFFGLWKMINAESIEKTGKPKTKPGALQFFNLLLGNLPENDTPFAPRGQNLMLLWLQILKSNEVVVGGRPHKLTKAAGMQLIGARPYFEDASSWANQLIANGSVLGSPARGHEKERKGMFLPRYTRYR